MCRVEEAAVCRAEEPQAEVASSFSAASVPSAPVASQDAEISQGQNLGDILSSGDVEGAVRLIESPDPILRREGIQLLQYWAKTRPDLLPLLQQRTWDAIYRIDTNTCSVADHYRYLGFLSIFPDLDRACEAGSAECQEVRRAVEHAVRDDYLEEGREAAYAALHEVDPERAEELRFESLNPQEGQDGSNDGQVPGTASLDPGPDLLHGAAFASLGTLPQSQTSPTRVEEMPSGGVTTTTIILTLSNGTQFVVDPSIARDVHLALTTAVGRGSESHGETAGRGPVASSSWAGLQTVPQGSAGRTGDPSPLDGAGSVSQPTLVWPQPVFNRSTIVAAIVTAIAREPQGTREGFCLALEGLIGPALVRQEGSQTHFGGGSNLSSNDLKRLYFVSVGPEGQVRVEHQRISVFPGIMALSFFDLYSTRGRSRGLEGRVPVQVAGGDIRAGSQVRRQSGKRQPKAGLELFSIGGVMSTTEGPFPMAIAYGNPLAAMASLEGRPHPPHKIADRAEEPLYTVRGRGSSDGFEQDPEGKGEWEWEIIEKEEGDDEEGETVPV